MAHDDRTRLEQPLALTRRQLIRGLGTAGTVVLISACTPSGPVAATASRAPSSSAPATASAQKLTLSLATYWSEPEARKALEKIAQAYGAQSGNTVNPSTAQVNDYQTQVPSYLTSGDPPDVMSFFMDERTRVFARQGLLLDISDVWNDLGNELPAAFKEPCSVNGKQYFMPTSSYWYDLFYLKPALERAGTPPPKTWTEFVDFCRRLKSAGLSPIALGDKITTFVAGVWLDYLTLGINGIEFRTRLMQGQESWTDPKVKKVFDVWREIQPFFMPDHGAYAWQEAVTPMVQGKAGMMLIGNFMVGVLPKEAQPSVDFFRFPVIDSAIPQAIVVVTDGYFAAAKAKNPAGSKNLLKFLGGKSASDTWSETAPDSIMTNNQSSTAALRPITKRGVEAIAAAKAVTSNLTRSTVTEMSSVVLSGIQEFLANPSATDSILATLEAKRREVFKV